MVKINKHRNNSQARGSLLVVLLNFYLQNNKLFLAIMKYKV